MMSRRAIIVLMVTHLQQRLEKILRMLGGMFAVDDNCVGDQLIRT